MRRASGTIHVFTFKEGVLSRAAHDLALRLECSEVTLDGDVLRAEFELASLFVVGPVESGVVRAERFDAATRSEIERAMHAHVLRTRRHPRAQFTGTAVPMDTGFEVNGKLELVGRSEPLSFPVRRSGSEFRADFELLPSRWGIEPYRALFGAIRLRDRVSIAAVVRESR
ncbi:MAG TPA: YceI family protein [Polyangiaceae bacterium]